MNDRQQPDDAPRASLRMAREGAGTGACAATPDQADLAHWPSAARRVLLQAPIGQRVVLDGAGTSFENPYVYDDVARELKLQAATGAIEIVDEQTRSVGMDTLICRLVFIRRR